MDDDRLKEFFPGLLGTEFEVTSEETVEYNCLAWAIGETFRRWDPCPGYYWPAGHARDAKVSTLVSLLRRFGFVECADGEPEENFEKVAIYARGIEWEHITRQLEDGRWTSKLGSLEDIAHQTVESLEGVHYGGILCYLKRPKPAPNSLRPMEPAL
ncbi:MAG: hypothetical protein WD066_10650 [Planctomycetaceae bacterium]